MSQKPPVTPGVRLLEQEGVPYTVHLYDWVEKGGTAHSSVELGVDEHTVVKTLVMQDAEGAPLIVLMHGDRQVSTKALARQLGVRSVSPCPPEAAQRHTGYLVGGISPFGTRKPLPVYVQKTVLDLPRIHINAGHRGFLVGITPADLVRVLRPVSVDVAVEG